jgi:hypothetical protein
MTSRATRTTAVIDAMRCRRNMSNMCRITAALPLWPGPRRIPLSDDAARRAAVDRVVRGIVDGTNGTGFRRRAMDAVDRDLPDDPV